MSDLKLIIYQFYRFALVGVFGSILNYSAFYVLLTYVDLHYLIAGALGFLLPVPIVFFINKHWTFKSNIDYAKGLSAYMVSNAIALFSSSMTQILVREVFGIPEKFTQLFGIFVSAIVNFALAKFFVFKEK
jgi:putative flippase GtrA